MIDNRFPHQLQYFVCVSILVIISIGRDILVCPLIFRRPNHEVDTFLFFSLGFTIIVRVEITIPLVRIVLVVNIV